jgi:hypothetical protein
MDRPISQPEDTEKDPISTARTFRPRFPWLTGDLQTLRNMIVRPRPSFADAPTARLGFDMADGTGDRLIGDLNRAPGPSRRPLALLLHGLTGCAESFYVLATARHLLDRGFAVLRLNLRGAGASAGLCREQYHAGRTSDLVGVLKGIDPELTRHGIVAVGYSLGGNMLLKHLGEAGAGTPLAGAAAISPPVDLAAAAACIRRPRNWLYQRYLLARMKDEARASRGGLDSVRAAATDAAADIVAFDDTVVAPRYGYASAADYYERCSALAFIAGVRVPTLVIHARDDPWIPSAAFEDPRWNPQLPTVRLLLTDGGGHVGFHGEGGKIPWHDRMIGSFFGSGVRRD